MSNKMNNSLQTLLKYNEYLSQKFDIDFEELEKESRSFITSLKKEGRKVTKKSRTQRIEDYVQYLIEEKDKLAMEWLEKFPDMQREEMNECWDKDIDDYLGDYLNKQDNFWEDIKKIQDKGERTLKKNIQLYEEMLNSFSRCSKKRLEPHIFMLGIEDHEKKNKDELVELIVRGFGRKMLFSGESIRKYEWKFISKRNVY